MSQIKCSEVYSKQDGTALSVLMSFKLSYACIPEVLWNLNRLFMESVSHLALKLLSLMGESVGLFP